MMDCELFIWKQINPSITLLIESKDEEAVMDKIESMIIDMIDHSACFISLSTDLVALVVASLQLSSDKPAAFDTICTNLLVFEWSSQHVLTGIYIMLKLCIECEDLDWADFETKVVHSLTSVAQSFTRSELKTCFFIIFRITIQRQNGIFLHNTINHFPSSTISEISAVVGEVLSSFSPTNADLSLWCNHIINNTTYTHSHAIKNQVCFLFAYSTSICSNHISSITMAKSQFDSMYQTMKLLILSQPENRILLQPNECNALVDILVGYALFVGIFDSHSHSNHDENDDDSELTSITTLMNSNIQSNLDVQTIITEHLVTRLISHNAGFLITDPAVVLAATDDDSLDCTQAQLVIIKLLLATLASASQSGSFVKTRAISLWMSSLSSEVVSSLMKVRGHRKLMNKLLTLETVFTAFVDVIQRYNLWSVAFGSPVVLSHVLRCMSVTAAAVTPLLEYHLTALINSSDIEERITIIHTLISYFQTKKQSEEASQAVRELLLGAVLRKYQPTESNTQIKFNHLILGYGSHDSDQLVFFDDFEAVLYLVGLLFPDVLKGRLSKFVLNDTSSTIDVDEDEGSSEILENFYTAVFSLLSPSPPTTSTAAAAPNCCLLLNYALMSGLCKACYHLSGPTTGVVISTFHNLLYGIIQLYTHTTANSSFLSSGNSGWMRIRSLYEDTLSRSINQGITDVTEHEQFRIIPCDNIIDCSTILPVFNHQLETSQTALQHLEAFIMHNKNRNILLLWSASEEFNNEQFYNLTWWEMNLISLTATLFELSQTLSNQHKQQQQQQQLIMVSEVVSLFRGYQSLASLSSLETLAVTLTTMWTLQDPAAAAAGTGNCSTESLKEKCLSLLEKALTTNDNKKIADSPQAMVEAAACQSFRVKNHTLQHARRLKNKIQSHPGLACCITVLQHLTVQTLDSMPNMDAVEKQKRLGQALITIQLMLWNIRSEWMELLQASIKSLLLLSRDEGEIADRDMLIDNMFTMFTEELLQSVMHGVSLTMFESNAELLFILSKQQKQQKQQQRKPDRVKEAARILIAMKFVGGGGQLVFRTLLNLAIQLSGRWEVGLRLQLFLYFCCCCNTGKVSNNKGPGNRNRQQNASKVNLDDDSSTDRGSDSDQDSSGSNNDDVDYDKSIADNIASWLRDEGDNDNEFIPPPQSILLSFDQKTAQSIFLEVIRHLTFTLKQLSDESNAPQQPPQSQQYKETLRKCEHFASTVLPITIALERNQQALWMKCGLRSQTQSLVYMFIAKFIQLLIQDVKRVFVVEKQQKLLPPLIGFMLSEDDREKRMSYYRLPFLSSLVTSTDFMKSFVEWIEHIQRQQQAVTKNVPPDKILVFRRNEQLTKFTMLKKELRSMLQAFESEEYSHSSCAFTSLLIDHCTLLYNSLATTKDGADGISPTKKRKGSDRSANSPPKKAKTSPTKRTTNKGSASCQRSRNPVIDQWIRYEEDGGDAYADLEGFLVDDDDDDL